MRSWISLLPTSVLAQIDSGKLVNLNLVKIDGGMLYTPKSKDLEANFLWLRPVCDLLSMRRLYSDDTL